MSGSGTFVQLYRRSEYDPEAHSKLMLRGMQDVVSQQLAAAAAATATASASASAAAAIRLEQVQVPMCSRDVHTFIF